MPYVEYYRRTGPAAVADLIDGILIYALLGLLMFERRYRLGQPVNRWALVAFAIAAAGFSLLLEAVQLSLPSRSSGLTDVVNAMVGVWVGYRLWGLLSGYRESRLVPASIEVSNRSGLRVHDH
jgi:VanZ family protein